MCAATRTSTRRSQGGGPAGDEAKTLHEEIQALLKRYEDDVDKRVDEKTKEVMTI